MTMGRHQTVPSLAELMRLPAGDRGPRLRSIIAFYRAKAESPHAHVQARHRTTIRKVHAVARLAGISCFAEV
jgi:hypothetical protein